MTPAETSVGMSSDLGIMAATLVLTDGSCRESVIPSAVLPVADRAAEGPGPDIEGLLAGISESVQEGIGTLHRTVYIA